MDRERADTPYVRSVSTSAGQVRVRDRGGDGPPVLPLGAHGLPLQPGADLTPPGLARLLVEVLDGLGVASASVVGVDTGGALTQLLMAHYRDRVDRVVLTACDAYEDFPPQSFGWLLRPLAWPGVAFAVAVAGRLRRVRRFAVPRPITHRGVPDDLLRQWTAPLRDAGVRRDLRTVVAGMQPRHTLAAAEANRDFPRPVLVAWGDDDRAFRRRLAERLVVDLPHARLVTLPDCGAFAAVDVPELLADLVDEHLRVAVH